MAKARARLDTRLEVRVEFIGGLAATSQAKHRRVLERDVHPTEAAPEPPRIGPREKPGR